MADDNNGPPEGPNVIDLFREVREAMPPLFAVPDTDPDEPANREGLSWNDLAFLAERIMLTALNKIDWSDLRDYAACVAEPEDVDDIVRLMQSATIEVAVGYVQ